MIKKEKETFLVSRERRESSSACRSARFKPRNTRHAQHLIFPLGDRGVHYATVLSKCACVSAIDTRHGRATRGRDGHALSAPHATRSSRVNSRLYIIRKRPCNRRRCSHHLVVIVVHDTHVHARSERVCMLNTPPSVRSNATPGTRSEGACNRMVHEGCKSRVPAKIAHDFLKSLKSFWSILELYGRRLQSPLVVRGML